MTYTHNTYFHYMLNQTSVFFLCTFSSYIGFKKSVACFNNKKMTSTFNPSYFMDTNTYANLSGFALSLPNTIRFCVKIVPFNESESMYSSDMRSRNCFRSIRRNSSSSPVCWVRSARAGNAESQLIRCAGPGWRHWSTEEQRLNRQSAVREKAGCQRKRNICGMRENGK